MSIAQRRRIDAEPASGRGLRAGRGRELAAAGDAGEEHPHTVRRVTHVHTTTSALRVRYAETDQMGVVYHTNYLVWCEVGRTDFMRQAGVTYADLERDGLRLAVADVHIRYLRAARYDDCIRVVTWIEAVQSRTVTFGYRIERNGEGRLERLATASTRLVALDANGTPRSLPRPLLQRFRDDLASRAP